MSDPVEQLHALKSLVTEDRLTETGGHFVDGNYASLTECHHGDTGEFRNKAAGKAIALLWNLWNDGKLGVRRDEGSPPTADRYLNLVDGKIYELVSQNDDGVTFKLQGRKTPHYLGRAEFDRRFRLQTPPPSSHVAMGPHLRAVGIGRDPENDRVVFLSLNRTPGDDELRAIHGAISRTPATCPFCTKPTYVLPCSHCGEPDVPDDQF